MVQYCVGRGTWRIKADEGMDTVLKLDSVEVGFVGFSGQHTYFYDGSTDSVVQVRRKKSMHALSILESPLWLGPLARSFSGLTDMMDSIGKQFTGRELLGAEPSAWAGLGPL